MLSFWNEEEQKLFPVFLKSIKNKPYFIVPFDIEDGVYELNYVIFDTKTQSYQFRSGKTVNGVKHFDFNSKIEIIDENVTNDEKEYEFENSNIEQYLEEIKKFEENTVITINANNNTVISKSVFECVKGKNITLKILCNNNEWYINGKDIDLVKDIDTNVSLINIKDSKFSEISKNGYVLSFADNGYLPGKTLIRIQIPKGSEESIGQKKYNAYYYNDAENNFDEIAINKIVSDDGYYEFYITHNSVLLVTDEKIADEKINSKEESINLNKEKDSNAITNWKRFINSSNDNTQENGEINVKLLIEIAIIVVCVVVLTLIISGKIFSNKKK